MKDKRYALLDTDFISKAHLSQKNGDEHLIDIVLQMPDYEFFCHEQIVLELSRHNIGDSPQWLSKRIDEGKIHCYSDKDILTTLCQFFGSSAKRQYTNMLEIACEAFEGDSFLRDYSEMQSISDEMENELFLQKLVLCDQAIGEGNSMGEKKSYILLQLLMYLNPGKVCVFCSDDGNARRGAIALTDPRNDDEQILCISILSLYQYLHETMGYEKAVLEPYFDTYEAFCKSAKQTTFRVYEATTVPRMTRVPCRQVFNEIF